MQQWVIMATFYTIQEAHLAATYLSSHAIEARIENENSNSILPVYGLSAAGIRLLVPVELAREKPSIYLRNIYQAKEVLFLFESCSQV